MKQVNTVILYKNFPVKGYDNQVYYSSKEARKSAFLKYKYKTLEDISTVNLTTGEIRTKLTYYVGNMVNYACIETEERDYFYFVDSVEWQSNGNCILHLSIDAWQTYVYDLYFHDSFVEREHVADDTFGKHIVDEGLPVFGVKACKTTEKVLSRNDLKLCVAIADVSGMTDTDTGDTLASYLSLDGTYSTAILYTDAVYTSVFTSLINELISDNKIDSIVGVYMAYVDDSKESYTGNLSYGNISRLKYIKDSYTLNIKEITIPHMTTIDGYSPSNKKCFTYPFNYIEISNVNGTSNQYQYELQSKATDAANFMIFYPIIHGANMFCVPSSYTDKYNRILSGSSNPEVGWIANTYSAYYSANKNALNAQNQAIKEDYALNTLNNGGSAIQGVAYSVGQANLGGMIGNLANFGLNELSNEISTGQKFRNMNASLADVQSKGNTLKGQFTTNAYTMTGKFGFIFYNMQACKECIEMVDDYFSMYGYKVACIKKPQWSTRPYWNFVKTSGCNVTGKVPCDMLKIIEQMFDNGTTIWKDLSYMYKYDTYKRNNTPQ